MAAIVTRETVLLLRAPASAALRTASLCGRQNDTMSTRLIARSSFRNTQIGFEIRVERIFLEEAQRLRIDRENCISPGYLTVQQMSSSRAPSQANVPPVGCVGVAGEGVEPESSAAKEVWHKMRQLCQPRGNVSLLVDCC